MANKRKVFQFNASNVTVEFFEGKALFRVADCEKILGTRVGNLLAAEEGLFCRAEFIDADWLLSLAQRLSLPMARDLEQWINDVVLPEANKPEPQRSLAKWKDYRASLFG